MLGLGLVAVAGGPASAQTQPRESFNPPPQIFEMPQQRAPQEWPQQRLDELRQQQQIQPQFEIPPSTRVVPRRGR
jgi:hypothetical protein